MMHRDMTVRPGLMALRYMRARHMARKDGPEAAAAFAASQNWLNGERIMIALKAGVSSTTDAALATRPIALDVAEAVRPLTIIGRLPGTKRLPFHSRLIGMSAGASASWVGEAGAAALGKVSFGTPAMLPRKKVVSLLVTPNELLESGDPQVEAALVADLVGAAAEAIDRAFLDPANTGAGAAPASITGAGFTQSSAGATIANIDSDLGVLLDALVAAGETLATAVWVLHPRTAVYLARLRGTSGALAYPGIGAAGGTLLGLPALVSAAMPMSEDSPRLTSISVISGDGVLIGDQGETELSFATQTLLEMDTEPSGDTLAPGAATKNLVSMFQTDSTAIKIVRSMNWLPRRATIAATLTAVTY